MMPEPVTADEIIARYKAVQARLYGMPPRAVVPIDRVKPEIRAALATQAKQEKERKERERRTLTAVWEHQRELGRATEAALSFPRIDGFSTRQLSAIASVLQRVSQETSILPAAILGESRSKAICDARDRAIALVAREFPEWGLTKLGKAFNRDHTTILHSLRKTGNWPRIA